MDDGDIIEAGAFSDMVINMPMHTYVPDDCVFSCVLRCLAVIELIGG